MDLSRQSSRPGSEGPLNQRGTLIELLVVIAIIGVLLEP
jgi:Tfp pilus assembly protein FimT